MIQRNCYVLGKLQRVNRFTLKHAITDYKPVFKIHIEVIFKQYSTKKKQKLQISCFKNFKAFVSFRKINYTVHISDTIAMIGN